MDDINQPVSQAKIQPLVYAQSVSAAMSQVDVTLMFYQSCPKMVTGNEINKSEPELIEVARIAIPIETASSLKVIFEKQFAALPQLKEGSNLAN